MLFQADSSFAIVVPGIFGRKLHIGIFKTARLVSQY
jgi:hypothetical protein